MQDTVSAGERRMTERRKLVREEMILRRLLSSSIRSNVLATAMYGTLGRMQSGNQNRIVLAVSI